MKNTILFLILTLPVFTCMAQKNTDDFEITLPTTKVAGCFYNSLHLIDARQNTKNLGIVQLGAFNKKAWVVNKIPLGLQLDNVMLALTDSTAGNGELLLLLRQLSFAEITGALQEKGYCYLRAILFAKTEDGYQQLNSIDTVVTFKALDVTRGLFRQSSKTITNFISGNLANAPSRAVTYSYNEVCAFDSLEKRNIALYDVQEYKNGLYKTFQSFANQTPFEIEYRVGISDDNRPQGIKIKNRKGKFEEISPRQLYAFVYNGYPFIATELGYYPLVKKNDDFYFTGQAKVAADAGNVLAAGLFFGIIGSLIASSPGSSVFEMKIDHISGGFIRIKEIKQQSDYKN